MRCRLYRYEDRIWDESFKINPEQELLPPILPVVFYQGETRWNYSTEFADLFPENLTATQEEKIVEAFAAPVEQHTEKKGRKIMTFAQQLFQEGKLVGEIRAQIEIVEKLLRAGISWTTIETATEIGPTRFAEL